MFFTGVTPVALYDVSSGSNIGLNISQDKRFNDAVGITKEELYTLIEYYNLEEKKDNIIKRCDYWYDSYRFNEEVSHTIYNSDMIFYYFYHLVKNNKEPNNIIDSNVRTDYSKLRFLIYSSQKLNGNFELLNKLITSQEVVVTNLTDNFSAFELQKESNFKSFLFSLGFMSMKKRLFQLSLYIPNQTIKKLLSEFIDYGYRSLEGYNVNVDKFNNLLGEFAIEKKLECFYYLSDIIKNHKVHLENYIRRVKEAYSKAYFLSIPLISNNFLWKVYWWKEKF